MIFQGRTVIAVAMMSIAGCAGMDNRDASSNGNEASPASKNTPIGALDTSSPATPQPKPSTTAAQGASILAASTPAAGSTVAGPVDELVLHFSPPARLGEVKVTGPDGEMPMMVTAVGETEHYSLPLSGLGAGAYTVSWRASAVGREHRGSFNFSVR